ncbi:uncharacterized protein [Aegilops tauschii subsp. strangulata]|uniref:uncharacterized protein isoform X1 n=1 Tax=Aegilops tauschii subsp. strangulata TaxID=200361 RepID=UPI001E1CAF87|nr:uncharacterized protein LOC109785613 isoform X1 [Aegilops tauschii subsp. strangulata]
MLTASACCSISRHAMPPPAYLFMPTTSSSSVTHPRKIRVPSASCFACSVRLLVYALTLQNARLHLFSALTPSSSPLAMSSCAIVIFPITYLRLPLLVRKPSVASLQPIIIKQLSTWHATLLSHGERLALVRHVLCAIPTHILVVLALCSPILKQINRSIREFLWHGWKETIPSMATVPCTGNVFVTLSSWVALGIPDLQRSGVALRVRWLWSQRIDPCRPWVHLHLPSDPDASSVFQASITWTVGNGHTCHFWTDPWIDDKAISDLAPSVLPLVARRRCKSCSVTDGLQGRSWVADIRARAHARCYDPVCAALEASSARIPFYRR